MMPQKAVQVKPLSIFWNTTYNNVRGKERGCVFIRCENIGYEWNTHFLPHYNLHVLMDNS